MKFQTCEELNGQWEKDAHRKRNQEKRGEWVRRDKVIHIGRKRCLSFLSVKLF